MKFKYFLRGLGVGIIISAVVLCIAFRSYDNTHINVVNEAKKLGMVFPEGTASPVSNNETASASVIKDSIDNENVEADKSKDSTIKSDKSKKKVSDKEENTKKPAETEKPAKENKATMKPKKEDKNATLKPGVTCTTAPQTRVVTSEGQRFEVRDGLLSSSIAREMKAAGIISNDKAFDKYLVRHGLGEKLINGVYYIPVGSSYKKIASIITGKSSKSKKTKKTKK